MSDPITRFLKGELVKIGCVGVAFVVLSPFLVFTFRPHDDVAYYLLRPEKVALGPDGEWKHNRFVEVAGRIDPATFQVHRQGILGMETDFKFCLEGYPKTFAICVTEGPFYDALFAAYQQDVGPKSGAGKREKVETLIADRFNKTVRAKVFGGEGLDSSWNHLGQILADDVTIEGRLHRSRPSGESAFDTFAAGRETRIAPYFDRVLGLDVDGSDWWLIDADERPEPVRFLDGNGLMFLVFFCVGVAALVWFCKRCFRSSSGGGPRSRPRRPVLVGRPSQPRALPPPLPPSAPPSRNPPPRRGAQWD